MGIVSFGNGDKGDKGGKPEKQDNKPAAKQTTKAPTKAARKNWRGFPFN